MTQTREQANALESGNYSIDLWPIATRVAEMWDVHVWKSPCGEILYPDHPFVNGTATARASAERMLADYVSDYRTVADRLQREATRLINDAQADGGDVLMSAKYRQAQLCYTEMLTLRSAAKPRRVSR